MGSFDYTCAVSNLPICGGTEVRLIMLTKNPFNEGYYIHGSWFPRSWALRATYNDYGTVEEIQDPALAQLWLDTLKIDLVEQGWGNNTVHDVPTSKNMSIETLLNALREKRVLVKNNSYWVRDFTRTQVTISKELEDSIECNTEDGIPTLKRLEKLLVDSGFPLFEDKNPYGYIISESPIHGQINIRINVWGKELKNLKAIEPAIAAAGYSHVITKGGENSCMMLVMPGPEVSNYRRQEDLLRESHQPVMQAMIREDVWQALCKIDIEESLYDGKNNTSIMLVADGLKSAAREAWKIASTWDKDPMMNPYSMRHYAGMAAWFANDPVPGMIGLGTAFFVAVQEAKNLSQTDIDQFLDGAAEMYFIQIVLATTRYQWRPSHSSGPQSGDWPLHEKVLEAFTSIAKLKREEFDVAMREG